MSKAFVFSIFCDELKDYPYVPFIAPTVEKGIYYYKKFISEADYICPHPELHIIGRCAYNPESKTADFNYLEPYLVPCRVEFKNNLYSKSVMLGYWIRDIFQSYLNRLQVYFKKRRKEN
ncbi:hypothetical protein [Dipodfec virus UOA04_Rod_819]|nr:hypothetical protein [Dipodfec virus UOA04_Rod_819]